VKLLLDHCVPRRLGPLFAGHQVTTVAQMRWDRLRNGILLNTAAEAGFDVRITVDQNMMHQQNLQALPIAVLVMCAVSNDIDELTKRMPLVLAALVTLQPRQYVEVR